MPRPCKRCESVNHTSFSCRMRPWKTLKRSTLRPVGKYTKQWLVTRSTWFKQHPADSYTCYLCGKRLSREETTLDHIKSRSRHPELRFNLDNLQPCCWPCNEAKGSKDLEEL